MDPKLLHEIAEWYKKNWKHPDVDQTLKKQLQMLFPVDDVNSMLDAIKPRLVATLVLQ